MKKLMLLLLSVVLQSGFLCGLDGGPAGAGGGGEGAAAGGAGLVVKLKRINFIKSGFFDIRGDVDYDHHHIYYNIPLLNIIKNGVVFLMSENCEAEDVNCTDPAGRKFKIVRGGEMGIAVRLQLCCDYMHYLFGRLKIKPDLATHHEFEHICHFIDEISQLNGADAIVYEKIIPEMLSILPPFFVEAHGDLVNVVLRRVLERCNELFDDLIPPAEGDAVRARLCLFLTYINSLGKHSGVGTQTRGFVYGFLQSVSDRQNALDPDFEDSDIGRILRAAIDRLAPFIEE